MEVYNFGLCITECCTPEMGEVTYSTDGTDNTLTVNFTACEPATNFQLWYRPKGSSITHRNGGTVTASPFVVVDSGDTPGTEYEGYILSDCGELEGPPVDFGLDPTIQIGGAICRIEGTCNDNALCAVRIMVDVGNAPPGSYIDVSGIVGPASITVFDSDPANGRIDYTEPNGLFSTSFNLELKDSIGLIIVSTATVISHQTFWPFLSECPE